MSTMPPGLVMNVAFPPVLLPKKLVNPLVVIGRRGWKFTCKRKCYRKWLHRD